MHYYMHDDARVILLFKEPCRLYSQLSSSARTIRVSDMNASAFNLPKTGNHILNKDNNKLHFRYFFPSAQSIPAPCGKVSLVDIESVIFWIHGYAGHVNRPETEKMAAILTRDKTAVFALDLQGHGYSEGTRALALSHTDLVDDVYDFISFVMALGATEPKRCTCDLSTDDLVVIRSLPFFVMGQVIMHRVF